MKPDPDPPKYSDSTEEETRKQKNDPDALARRFLDLWEDQIAALASDPQTMKAAGQILALSTQLSTQLWKDPFLSAFTTNILPPLPLPEKTLSQETPPQRSTADETKASSSPSAFGPPPPAPASGDSHHDLADIKHRLEALENRLARLESGTRKTSRRS